MPDPAMTTRPEPVRVSLVTQPLGFWGSLQAVRRNVLSIIPDLATRQPMVSGRTGIRWHMVMDPVANRRVLLENADNYPKSSATKNLLRPAIGESLFVAEGAHWRWQRRAAAPVFSHRNVSALGSVMTGAAERACDRLASVGRGQSINVADEMVRATFEVISDVTFSGGQTFDRAALHRAIDAYISAAGRISPLDMIGAPDWVPRPSRLVTGPTLRRMKAVADDAIATRNNRGPVAGTQDLLDLLLAAQDPKSGRQMTAAELRDNLLTFIVAGHETTALTLGWSLYLCGVDPEVQEQARQEACAVLGRRAATADDIASLPLTRAIVDESLRLYPAAGVISRTARGPDELCGREIRAGDTVILPIYALHRHKLLWDNPDGFDPSRFAPGAKIDRYAYLPFSDGPRICIGASFAVQEAVIILATLLARFRFRATPGRAPEPVMIITLRPQGGIWMEVEPVD